MENGKLARVLRDGLSFGPDLIKTEPPNAAPGAGEMRARLPLSWTVYLTPIGCKDTIPARTITISCQGFFCHFEGPLAPFAVGDAVRCRLLIPAHEPKLPRRVLPLDCQTTVVRVDLIATDIHGVTFEIDSGWQLSTRYAHNSSDVSP